MSSLLKVSPCSLYESTKVDKKIKKKPKRLEKPKKSQVAVKEEPNIIPAITSTEYTTCRINSYSDNSKVVEILRASNENCSGDVKEKSDLVIIILSDGNAAFFTSKCNN